MYVDTGVLGGTEYAYVNYAPNFLHHSILNFSLHYAQFYSFYAVSSNTIPYLQLKLPIGLSSLT